MSFWTFLKSVPGKITMVATTAIAGIAANFAGAAMVDRKPLELEAIKKGVVEGGGNVDGMTDAEVWSGWDSIVEAVNTYSFPDDSSIMKMYRAVNDNLSQVDFQTHIQGLSIGLTVATVVIVGVIWFLLYRKATKMAT